MIDRAVRVSPSAAARRPARRHGAGASARRRAIRTTRHLEAAQVLPRLPAGELRRLTIALPAARPKWASPAFFKTGGVYYE